jgi:hypothetical protein
MTIGRYACRVHTVLGYTKQSAQGNPAFIYNNPVQEAHGIFYRDIVRPLAINVCNSFASMTLGEQMCPVPAFVDAREEPLIFDCIDVLSEEEKELKHKRRRLQLILFAEDPDDDVDGEPVAKRRRIFK